MHSDPENASWDNQVHDFVPKYEYFWAWETADTGCD